MLNLTDIVGAGTTVQISSTNVTARWIDFVVTGSGTVRIGDSLTTATRGLPVPTGSGYTTPAMIEIGGAPPYSLAGFYAYVPAGATLSVAYEPYN
jgi:hypothetical protein